MRTDVLGICGLGLIGSSIARAYRDHGRIAAFDPDPEVRANAATIGVEAAESLAELGACDLVVLAAPTQTNIDLLHVFMAANARPVVMDAGSVKSGIVAAWRDTDPSYPFVATHPMAGSELAGFSAGRGDLFAGAPWPMVVQEGTDPHALVAVTDLILLLGGAPVPVSADAHDHAVADISHLPHLLAGGLGNVVGSSGAGLLAQELAAGSFRDVSRVSASPPERTAEFITANADYAASRARAAADELNRAAAFLETGDQQGLVEWLRAANAVRLRQDARSMTPTQSSTWQEANEVRARLLLVRDSGRAISSLNHADGRFQMVLTGLQDQD
jgi:prephenate dehydrogenase